MTDRREAPRFRRLMRAAGRNRDASRVIVSLLRADSKAAQNLERALSDADLSLPQFNVLMVLAASDDAALPLYELNKLLVSTPPNTSWLSTRMEQRGLVRKTRAADDARVVVLEITERGWTKLADAAPLVFRAEKEMLGDFSKDELKTFAELLRRFLD